MDVGLDDEFLRDVLQVRLPADFLVRNNSKKLRRKAGVCGVSRVRGEELVQLHSCLGNMQKGILIWDK